MNSVKYDHRIHKRKNIFKGFITKEKKTILENHPSNKFFHFVKCYKGYKWYIKPRYIIEKQ